MSKLSHILTHEESELLLAFESASSLEKISMLIGKDVSNVSRSLTKISEKLPVVEKQNNRWQLTNLGKTLNEHTRDSIQFQKSLVNQQNFLKIGTNREFASRILGTRLQELIEIFPNTQLRICAFETGVESALLNGQVDIGIDCERPYSPDISYKLCLDEEIIAVCSPQFKKNHLKDLKEGEFFNLPHLLCDRLYPDRIFKRSDNKLNVIASFNDIATTRSACLEGFAWALLPRYAVQKELDSKSLVQIEYPDVGYSSYGIWWVRSRKSIEASALKLKDWVKNSDLTKQP
jgi:DNA-binding transcriptional LysR family regulator